MDSDLGPITSEEYLCNSRLEAKRNIREIDATLRLPRLPPSDDAESVSAPFPSAQCGSGYACRPPSYQRSTCFRCPASVLFHGVVQKGSREDVGIVFGEANWTRYWMYAFCVSNKLHGNHLPVLVFTALLALCA
jgi:hypothetical protein